MSLAPLPAITSLNAMTTTVFDPEMLSSLVPHRGVNLLPDEVVHLENGTECRFTAHVPADDPRGRTLFGRRGPGGIRAWQEYVLPEILAIGGISLLGKRLQEAGQEGVYSAISRVSAEGIVSMDEPIEGSARITRDRGSFIQFQGSIAQGGKTLMSGEFMSGSAALGDIAAGAVMADAEPGTDPLVADFSWKPEAMRFIDAVRSWDADSATLEASYGYPTDHPLVPGHFPDVPVMMGVTQWTAIADAAWEACARASISGPVEAEGTIVRADGSDVVDVRGLVLDVEDGMPILRATKRVAFRGPVQPGDGLRIKVSVRAC